MTDDQTSPDPQTRVLDLFSQACDLPREQVPAFLDEACGDDETLRAEVESLLVYDQDTSPFLDGPAAAVERLSTWLGRSTPDVAIPGATPERMGDYEILDTLGEGGMGIVYLAEQRAPVKRHVALKVLKLGMNSREVIARFEAERQALALMDHPGIARVYDAGVTPEGRPYFAMEHVDGVQITDYCDENGLDTQARLELFVAVCEAVQHAHQKGLIHRDLKPSNVLVPTVDGRPAVKVIDFGIAKAIDQPLTEETLRTEAGQLIGTPEYMSPEQAAIGPAGVDTRSDIYSLGVLLYRLLTGVLPFDAARLRSGNIFEIQRMISEVDPPKPSTRLGTLAGESDAKQSADFARRRRSDASTIARQLRGDLDWITMRAMEKDRSRRYASASELAADIIRHLGHEPVLAGPPGTMYRFSKFVRRHRAGVIGAAAVIVVLVGGVAGTTSQAILAEQRRAEAAEQAAIASAVNDFLNKDLLAAVAPTGRAGQGRNVSMREVLDVAAARIDEAAAPGGRFHGRPRVEAAIRRTIGGTYLDLGAFDVAEAHLLRAHSLLDEAMGPQARDTLGAMSDLGLLYWRQGRYAEAEAVNERALELRTRAFGPEHRDTLASMNNLALIYNRQGRGAEAIELQERALEIKQRVFGPDHPDTLTSMNNLAIAYDDQGRYEDALSLQWETYERRVDVLGPEHPHTLSSLNNLGVTYDRTGDFERSEPLHVECLEIRRRILGDFHADTLDNMNNLASVYLQTNRFDEALPLLEEALAGLRETLGPDHPRTLRVLNNLADVLDALGSTDEANDHRTEHLDGLRRLAERDGATVFIKNEAAWTLLTVEPPELRNPGAALVLALEAAEGTSFGDPSILDTLSLAYHLTGDTPKAIENQEKAIELVPEGDLALRAELEAALQRYEAASQ